MRQFVYLFVLTLFLANCYAGTAQEKKHIPTTKKQGTQLARKKANVTLTVDYPEIVDQSDIEFKNHVVFTIDAPADNIIVKLKIKTDGILKEYEMEKGLGYAISFNNTLSIVSSDYEYKLIDENKILAKFK